MNTTTNLVESKTPDTAATGWTYRLAEVSDADMFADWVRNNPDIDRGDVQRTINGYNPTTIFLVACYDGVPKAFAPVLCQMHLCHLAFSPDARATEKLQAVTGLLDFAMAIAVQYKIREITTATKSSYAMGKFAAHLGFKKSDRELFTFDINEILKQAVPTSAPDEQQPAPESMVN